MGRATLIDETTEEEIKQQVEETDQLDLQDTTEDIPEEPVQSAEDDDDIPDKYKGKSVKELIEMHRNAEKHMGKQSSEVGELRKVVDDFIQGQLATQQSAPATQDDQDDDTDFFVDPRTAVERAISNHPKIKEAEQYTLQQKKAAAEATLKANHPDMDQILSKPEFAEWVKASKFRTQLFVQADQQYDSEAADELFGMWKERQSVVQRSVEVDKQARKNTVKSAATGNARGSTEPARKKIYRRADIIKLMKTDPQRYQQMSDEIFKAYSEGRVK